jgi:mannose-6-phosphate isomerase
MPAEWRGSRLANTPEFPTLVKFLFTTDKLSIQVHPDDVYASVHEASAGGRGKTEMWHIISAEPGAKVLAGLKPGSTKEKFLAALASKSLEDLLVAWPVAAGDTIFLPARTPHTIGPGMILCEIQEYSDLTYRVYDYGRLDARGKPRELHIQKALEVINFGPSAGGKIPPLELQAKPGKDTLLAACAYFAAERWDLKSTLQMQSCTDHFELLVILQGTGYIQWQGSSVAYRPGECWLIPASLGKFTVQLEQSSTLIRSYIPDLPTLRSQLAAAGISDSELSRTVIE